MTCTKTKYTSQQFAIDDIERIKKKSTRSIIPIRSYYCSCGFWHITSKIDHYELKHQIEVLEELNKIINDQNKKDTEIAIRTDERIVKLNQKIQKLYKLLSVIRDDKLNLINEIVKLKKLIQ